MNDIKTINSYLDGNKDCFWDLYDKYVDKIYRFVYIKINNKNITEDIVSDVFLSVINNISSFKVEPNSSFKAWIYKIAYNKVIDFYKSNYKNNTEEIWDYLDMSFNEDLSQSIDNKDKIKEIFSHLKTIKKQHRDIIIYRVWEWLSFKEISDITGMSLDNCKKISSRILKQINKTFVVILFILII